MNNNEPQREEIKAAKVYKLQPEVPEEPKVEPKPEEVQQPVVEEKPIEQPVKVKKKNYLARFFFLIIIVLGAYIGYTKYTTDITIRRLQEMSSPVSTTKDTKELDLNSTIVQQLYSKVKTNIREDLQEKGLTTEMKMYLAYRQIPESEFFISNCEGFDNAGIIPYVCNLNDPNFTPMAFKKEALEVQYKALFGDYDNFTYQNIQIGKKCLGGYEYIESRGEYVQGTCPQTVTTTIKSTKKLVKAESRETYIYLTEEVKNVASEGSSVPDYIKSGNYKYVFKLDNNYNYIYIDKYLEEE